MKWIIFTGVLIAILIIRKINKSKVAKELDLTQTVKIRFVKCEYGEYEIQFLNPVYDSWWTLPGGYAGIHAKWSFYNKGSYGAYSLERYTVPRYRNVEDYRSQFQTLADIQRWFDKMNRDYEDFQRREAIRNAEPNVIY